MSSFTSLLDSLNLKPVSRPVKSGHSAHSERGEKPGEEHCENRTENADTFEGKNLYIPTGATYGGLYLAQSILAAALTTSEYRLPNSLHVYYISPGNLSFPTTYAVERLRDGAKYSHREVSATQASTGDRPQFKAMVSFHEGEDTGARFQTAKLPSVPNPRDAEGNHEALRKFGETAVAGFWSWIDYITLDYPIEAVELDSSMFIAADARATPGDMSARPIVQAVWARMRPKDGAAFDEFVQQFCEEHGLKKSAEQLLQRALLAFITDAHAFEPAMRQGGLSWQTKGAAYASLDHSQYFSNDDIDLREWHLITGVSPNAGFGRGLGQGYIFTESGKLVSSFQQEGMLRADLGRK